jgi:hypothetical protein
VLELIRVYLGYCFECRTAALVGEYKVTGWRHHVVTCAPCLQAKADKLGQAIPPKEDAT